VINLTRCRINLVGEKAETELRNSATRNRNPMKGKTFISFSKITSKLTLHNSKPPRPNVESEIVEPPPNKVIHSHHYHQTLHIVPEPPPPQPTQARRHHHPLHQSNFSLNTKHRVIHHRPHHHWGFCLAGEPPTSVAMAFVLSVLSAMIVVCVFLARKKGVVRKNIEQRRSCGFERSKVPTRLSLSEIKSARFSLLKFVSEKNVKIYETDFGIRFILFWNGSRIPFLEKKLKFVKRNSWSVSEKYETDPKSRFIKKTWKLMKRISRFVSYFSETNHEFRFWKKKIKKYQCALMCVYTWKVLGVSIIWYVPGEWNVVCTMSVSEWEKCKIVSVLCLN